mmetsp:Transcript_17833/g.31637  ORF Transcript_17833/g.31637 Transcript_17833/m.31637 type:complete len:88 (-) Transcript_17833:137-400(-)
MRGYAPNPYCPPPNHNAGVQDKGPAQVCLSQDRSQPLIIKGHEVGERRQTKPNPCNGLGVDVPVPSSESPVPPRAAVHTALLSPATP